MDYNNKEQEIRALLEKYFEADTSLREEAELKEYFSTQQELPSDLLYARQWFGYLGPAKCCRDLPFPYVLQALTGRLIKILLLKPRLPLRQTIGSLKKSLACSGNGSGRQSP